MSNPVAWFEIYVQDLARAAAFYEKVFQIKLNPLPTAHDGDLQLWAFPSDMNTYGTGGALVQMKGVPSGGNSTLVYFHCEDCAVEASRVEGAGGKVERPKCDIGEYGFIALIQDTEGNLVGLHSMK